MTASPWSPQNKPKIHTRVIIDPSVSTKYPGVWIVEKIMQVNVVLHREGNPIGEKKLRIRSEYLLPASAAVAPSDSNATVIGNGGATWHTHADGNGGTLIPTYPHLPLGTIVQVKGSSKIKETTLFVVLTDNTIKNNTVKLAVLGGDDRYWPKIPRAWITVVPLADLLTR